MKIGMLGTGDVGKALGKAFIALGHEVKMGSRDAANPKAAEWAASAGKGASVGTFAEAARFGDWAVLATLGSATVGVLKTVGKEAFAGKVVLDTTNPLRFVGGKPELYIGHTDSLGEAVQRALPGAKVVKAFNTVGNAHMFKPDFPGGPPDMFIAGDDADAKRQVGALLRDFGWGTLDLGGISSSRYLEPLCMVWVLHAMQYGGWNHAFKMLHKS